MKLADIVSDLEFCLRTLKQVGFVNYKKDRLRLPTNKDITSLTTNSTSNLTSFDTFNLKQVSDNSIKTKTMSTMPSNVAKPIAIESIKNYYVTPEAKYLT